MNNIIRNLLWTEGKWILLTIGMASLLSMYYWWYGLIFIVPFFIFSVYFFRYPHRTCPEALIDKTVIISPADGRVMAIVKEIDAVTGHKATRVAIFLSPFDVHVNWVPFTGIVTAMRYKSGSFACAFDLHRSAFNEQHHVFFENDQGRTVLVTQIAGLIARRICWWVSQDTHVRVGDTFGMIRFGSRVDVVIPGDCQINVKVNEYVYGGKTVLGRLI